MHDDTFERQSLHKHYSVPRPVPLTTHHYLSSERRQQKIIEASNSCLFFLLFSGEIMLNIFFIDLFIRVENEWLKVCVAATQMLSGSLRLPLGWQLWLEERFQGPSGVLIK